MSPVAKESPGSVSEIKLSQHLEEQYWSREWGVVLLSPADARKEVVGFLMDFYREHSTSRAYPGAGIPGSMPSTLIEALYDISNRDEGHLWNFDVIKKEIDQKRQEELSAQEEMNRLMYQGGKV
jgi:hypothetical protein